MYSRAAVRRRLKTSGITFDDQKVDFTGVTDKRRSDQVLDKLLFQKGKRKAGKNRLKR